MNLRYIVSLLSIAVLVGLTGCQTSPEVDALDATVDTNPDAPVETPTSADTTSSEPESDLLTEEERIEKGYPSDEEIETLAVLYTPYEFYETSLTSLENNLGFTLQEENKLTEAELQDYMDATCEAIENNEGVANIKAVAQGLRDADSPKVTEFDEHAGALSAVSVYMECPEYAASLQSDFIDKYN